MEYARVTILPTLVYQPSTTQPTESETIGGSCAGLTSSVCLGQFRIGSADNGTYIDPAHLPSPGDKVLSTTDSSGPLTTPPGGATMTVTLMTNTYTITAATYNSANVGSGSPPTSSANSNGQGSTTPKPNSGSTIRYGPIMTLILFPLIFISRRGVQGVLPYKVKSLHDRYGPVVWLGPVAGLIYYL
jgi:hypothetical protein